MNRQYKRALKKQEAKRATAPPPRPASATAPGARRERTKPRQFVKEVVAELQKVAWPTRQEVLAYSLVVLVSVVVISVIINAMDYVFAKGVLSLFGVDV